METAMKSLQLGLVGGKSNHISIRGQVELEARAGEILSKDVSKVAGFTALEIRAVTWAKAVPWEWSILENDYTGVRAQRKKAE